MNGSNLEIRRWQVTAWLLTCLSALWFGLSIPAVRQLQSLPPASSVGPMDWLAIGLIAAHVLLITVAVKAWIGGKREVVLVEEFRFSGKQTPDQSWASQMLVFLTFFCALQVFNPGWTGIAVVMLVLLMFRRI
ncbi:MAG: hypothetical protein AB1705_18555 [Verrucomicrobiota bacterium]